MKTSIASAFYDKNVEVLEVKTTIDAEGGVNSKGLSVINSFKGNVSYSNCRKVQEEYGLDCDIDITITTDYEGINLNDKIKYQDVVYDVTDVIKNDSHFMIVCAKWHQ